MHLETRPSAVMTSDHGHATAVNPRDLIDLRLEDLARDGLVCRPR